MSFSNRGHGLRACSLLAAVLALAGCPLGRSGPRMDPAVNPAPDARVQPGNAQSRTLYCSSGNTLAAVWIDVRHEGPQGEMYFARSEDGGRTWASDVRLGRPGDPERRGHRYPRLVCDGDTIHVAWWSKVRVTGEGEEVGQKFIRYRRSTDGGKSWGPLLSVNTGAEGFVPSLAVDGSTGVFLAWNDERHGGGHSIYYNRSLDGGVSWPEQDFRLDTNTGTAPGAAKEGVRVSLTTAAGRLFAVWEGVIESGALPYFRYSEDQAATWSEYSTPLVGYDQMAAILAPEILVSSDGSRLLIVWQGILADTTRHWGLFALSSSDGGETWDETASELIPPHPRNQPAHIIADAAGTLHIVYSDPAAGPKPSVFYARSEDWGKTWVHRLRLDQGSPTGTVTTEFPEIAAGPEGRLLAVWMDRRREGRSSVYGRYSLDSGISWSEDFYVGGGSDASSDATQPVVLFLEDGTALAAWQEAYRGPQGLRTRRIHLP